MFVSFPEGGAMMKRALAVLLCLGIAFLPAMSQAGAGTKVPGFYKSLLPPLPKLKLLNGTGETLPKLTLTVAAKSKPKTASAATPSPASTSSDTLPVAQTDNSGQIVLGQGISSISVDSSQDKMVIIQNTPHAIQNWSSFNIGANAWVQFDQKGNSSWVVLNRIFDLNPSLIFGKLTAEGQVYLINQNGILFGPGSQVNVHTLIASSLNISNSDFMNGVLHFTAGDYQGTGNTNYLNASVINQGTITTDTLGSVFLLGPNVENDGTIQTQTGQIGLAAGTDISLFYDTSTGRTALVVDVLQTAGDAVNDGQMTAQTGLIGMYGANVDQNGVITAVTALKKNGEIELMASDSVITGAGSITSTPISTSTETADQSFGFQGGVISILGLDPLNPLNPAAAVTQIVNQGLIQAPSGTIIMNAQNRVYLETGSSIDVSGSWIDEPAAANTTHVQLNSVNLRDDPDQKNGILKGATVTVNNLLGSSIGDISGSLNTQEQTALQRSLTGGSISIASQGDVIVKEGASLDFSGGGTNYTAGYITTTELVSGGKTYAISSAPEALTYNQILSVSTYMNSYVEGANAGSLSLAARQIVLDGNIQGAATAGVYQTRTSELVNSMGNQNSLGLAAPVGGTLIIGVPFTAGFIEGHDCLLDSVVLQSVVAPLPPGFGPDDQPYDPTVPGTTYLSTQKLSSAGLSNLQIAANTTLTVTADADISLNPGSTLSLEARAIDFQGKINVPSGDINLIVIDNVTAFPSLDGSSSIDNPRYVPLSSQIYLAEGSQIDASGQRIDDSLAATGSGSSAAFTYIAGGSVTIQDQSYYGQGVISAAGSLIDVSGGYGISQKGVVTGGNAGTLSIQGAGIVLDGDLNAYSIQGSNGGSIALTAQSITIAPSASSNQNLDNTLVLGQTQLDERGFTQINLRSVNDITVGLGVSLSPSMVKLSTPVPGGNNSGDVLTSVTQDLIGKSSISLTAGILFTTPDTGLPQFNFPVYQPNENAPIQVLEGAQVNVAPGGSIALKAPTVTIDGVLNAPAGTVGITATLLTLQSGGTISAAGYNEPGQQPIMPGYPVSYTALPGGSVTLSAPNGSVTMDAGSVVDVSGSSPVTTWLLNGGGVPTALTVASNPGSVTISALTPSLNGTLQGQANLPSLQGGTLSITSLSFQNGYTLSNSDFANYIAGGFDALTFRSYTALVFSGPMDFTVGRSLTLDAPCFTELGSDQIKLQAPYIQVEDTYVNGLGQAPVTSSGASQLTLAGGWIDVSGSVYLSGFQDVTLSAVHDITLSDYLYGATWQGRMLTPADLTLQADRIYPTTLSDFTINSGGTVTILPSDSHNSSPIYSAGGNLTILAQGIDMEGGEVAAPMGQITLQAAGRVYLAQGSTVSTAGSVAVDYGSLNDVFWTIVDKANTSDANGITVSGAPQRSVNITGSEVIMMPGSTIDISGGGSIFAYQFQAGIQGSVDPFQTAGRYIIVPSADYSLPGPAVYLQGATGLPAGVYTLLPEQYAFLPGAMVITNTGVNVTPGTQKVSADGFPVVAGYFTYAGTSIQPALMEAFEVQPAAYVFKQGTFNTSTFVAGNAGTVTLSGYTAILDGAIQAGALQGFQGGTISLSGSDVIVEATTVPLPSGFDFNIPVPYYLSRTLDVTASAISGQGFKEIDLGDLSTTSTITMEQGSILNAASVVLSAQTNITLESGAQINTVDSTGTGSAGLITPNGLLTMQQNSLVHASDLVTMTIGGIDFQGALQIDHGALNLTGQNVYFVPQGSSQTGPSGLYLTSAFWSNFGNFNDVRLSASGGSSDGSTQGVVWFPGGTGSVPSNISLSAKNSFTINAAAIEWSNASDNGSVSITAPAISLENRGGGTPQAPSLSNAGSLTLNANAISVGEGPLLGGSMSANSSVNGLLIDGFSTINFNAVNAITFNGSGSLTTGGNLNFASGRITTSYYQDTNTPYTAANFTVSTTGTVNIAPPQGGAAAPQATVTPGGTLEIDGTSIDVSGVIEVASGTLRLNGTNGVTLESSAQVLDGGSTQTITVNGHNTYVCTPGGSVYLNADSGPVNIATGAVVDVSGVQNDRSTDPNDLGVNAGLISIYSPTARFNLQGTLKGTAGTMTGYNSVGAGGSFILDAGNLNNDFSSLYSMLASGGFTDSVDIRSRTDSLLTIAGPVTARQFTLTADQGSIDVKGSILASDPNGDSSVVLYAGSDLTLYSGSAISATGSRSSAHGGEILLSSTGGTLYFQQGATLDVSGGAPGQGGSVYFRAPQNSAGNDVNMNLDGSITGAGQILAEAFQTYSLPVDNTNTAYITSNDITAWRADIQTFMNSYGSAVKRRLLSNLTLDSGGAAGFNFVPGLEIDSTGNLTLNAAWNLTSWRYGANSVPGMLTLRAAGDLNIDQDLVDHPTAMASLLSTTAQPSWGMTLVAGADLSSSDPSEFVRGTGNLTVANGIVVYSESAPLRFAAGNDLTINSGAAPGYMINNTIQYNIGTYSGSITVNTGNDLDIKGGAIQSATGNIDVQVGGDLDLTSVNNSLGTIRTTGESPNIYSTQYWTYGNGGNIAIDVEGNVNGQVLEFATNIDLDGWDSYNMSGVNPKGWSASYITNSTSRATEGLATMAGGNLTVYAGGSFLCQAGTFGEGDAGNLTIFSGGNMQGRFLIADGAGELNSMGNFGTSGTPHLPIELFAAILNVTAQGEIDIGTIINPTIARPVGPSYNNNSRVSWDLEYSPTTSVSLTSVTGDVTLYGDDSFYGAFPNGGAIGLSILPPTVAIAAGMDINILADFALAPSATGNLTLIAGRDIDGQLANGLRAEIYMSDMSDALPGQAYDEVYGPQSGFSPSALFNSTAADPAGLLHAGDGTPVVVSAGRNISDLELFLPKKADVTAGGNISDLYFFGNNISAGDVTIIKAGGNILFSSLPNADTDNTGIQEGGPGALVVEAGLSMDLGTTAGIQTVGNTFNGSLGETGCTLIVASGYSKDFSDTAADVAFFTALSAQGVIYSNDMAAGETAEANQVVAAARTGIIAPFFAGSANAGAGDIDMTTSQISTLSAGGGIFIFANGSVNVGKSTFFANESQIQSTGIFTAQGGPINIFANGDLNVNESRIMTFQGGDITVWDDTGSINAGRGSKTEVDASPPTLTYVNGQLVLVFNPPSVGSGIRAVTYAPDGVDGPVPAPPAGNIYLFAPQGVINAGEAGIAGRNVILGALQVLNANNIIFSGTSVGVPSSANVSGLGALASTGSVTQGLQTQEAAIMSAAAGKLAPADSSADAFSTAWLEVRVLSFFEVDPGDGAWENTDN
jgi:filamentous hemagglutinin family protein